MNASRTTLTGSSRVAIVAGRIVLAGLAVAIAAIHFYLWKHYGYRNIPTIGALFLLNAIGGAVLALACLVLPRRLLVLAGAGVAGFGASTLGALIYSRNATLFGFHESAHAPLENASIAVEAAAVVIGVIVAAAMLSLSPFRKPKRGVPSVPGGP